MPPKKRGREALALDIPNELQIIGFEKNLDIMGFFIADEFRGKTDERPTERQIEYFLTRNGRPYQLRYTLKGTSSGLPNSTDKDVWNAVQSILFQQKRETRAISNPVSFTAMQVLNEMSVPANGSNYKKINDCFTRFKETTISSADVVYNAVRKKYNEKHFSVISRWEKTGASGLDGSDRNEIYQVWLDQNILDNLNIGYVQMEDFAAYKQLSRPTAKVLIGNLYFWFGAADESYVARDYTDLCNLLGITCYRQKSKIKEKFGPSLNELVRIGYLERWDIQRMSTKMTGYKICMWAGPEMVRVINTVKGMKRQKQKALAAAADVKKELTDEQKGAMEALVEQGVSQDRARDLALCHNPEYIRDQIEFGLTIIKDDRNGRRRLENPSGYLIWRIASDIQIPSAFFESRKRNRAQQKVQAESQRLSALHVEFVQWKERAIDAEIQASFTKQELEEKVDEIYKMYILRDKTFQKWSREGRRNGAMQLLRRDIATELMLPSFDQWIIEHPQGQLF